MAPSRGIQTGSIPEFSVTVPDKLMVSTGPGTIGPGIIWAGAQLHRTTINRMAIARFLHRLDIIYSSPFKLFFL
jgi:hypothetical protein